jgi:outer membrane protein
MPSTSPSPDQPWVAPPEAKTAVSTGPGSLPLPPPTLPAQLVRDSGRLTLTQVVELALQNSPATRAAWLTSRSAAATYGEQGGAPFPSLSVGASATTNQQVANSVRFGGRRNQVSPTASLSYLVYDVGGRAGARDAAEDGLFAAGFNHDAVIQGTVLQAEQAYFGYMANRALLDAQQASVAEAQAVMDAAQHRHDVGLATIADVLEARTSLSQARLAAESTQGTLQAARASLAVSMGLPANASFDVAPPPDTTPVGSVTESVDSLISLAVRSRPDLSAAEAQAQEADAAARVTRSRLFPSLSLNGNAGRVYSDVPQFSGASYTFSLSLDLPLFTGGANRFAAEAASANEEAAAAQARSLRDQVMQQVFTSYYALQGTSNDLLASAIQSEDVARGRYQEGVGTIVDLLTAQGSLADARAQQSQARWSWLVSLAQLAHDVGVLGTDGASPLPISPDSTEAAAPSLP